MTKIKNLNEFICKKYKKTISHCLHVVMSSGASGVKSDGSFC